MCHSINIQWKESAPPHPSSLPLEFCTNPIRQVSHLSFAQTPSIKSPTWVLQSAELVLCWMPMCPHPLLMLIHRTKYQQCSPFILGFGVLKLLITLNSSNWLRVHSLPNSISMVHHTLADVCDPLMVHNPCSLSISYWNQWNYANPLVPCFKRNANLPFTNNIPQSTSYMFNNSTEFSNMPWDCKQRNKVPLLNIFEHPLTSISQTIFWVISFTFPNSSCWNIDTMLHINIPNCNK
jgi:hypothetical protein